MDDKERTRISKFLSFVLRHEPASIGAVLDDGGWIDVDVLLERARAHGHVIARAMLTEIVATTPKQRFAFSADGARIRASQGHSIDVELGYEPKEPPSILFHGTT